MSFVKTENDREQCLTDDLKTMRAWYSSIARSQNNFLLISFNQKFDIQFLVSWSGYDFYRLVKYPGIFVTGTPPRFQFKVFLVVVAVAVVCEPFGLSKSLSFSFYFPFNFFLISFDQQFDIQFLVSWSSYDFYRVMRFPRIFVTGTPPRFQFQVFLVVVAVAVDI